MTREPTLETVEAIARVLYERDPHNARDPWDSSPDEWKSRFRADARAVLDHPIIKEMVGALERVMVGGNHAALLIGVDHPPHTASHDEARAHYYAKGEPGPEAYEAWCCWKTIMDASTALSHFQADEEVKADVGS